MASHIELRVSKDGGSTWSDWKARDLGETGDFIKPVIWRRLGNARHFTFDFRATGAPDILAGSILDALGEWVEAPVVGGAYADENRPWSSQDTCNYIPVAAEKQGARSMAKLRGVPGERLFANVGPGPIRGARDVEGKLFVVSGTGLYRVFADTSSTLLGTIPGSGRCSLTHNQEGGGAKLVVGNGTRGFTYDTITEVFAEIDDEAFPGFLTCDYLDQFVLGIEPQRRFAFHSELADAREYSSLDRLESESSPDRLLAQAVNAGQWWLFGERTIDVYANTGAGTGTFQRIPGSTVDRGIAGTYALAKLDNTLFFWGDDGTFYRLNGYTPVRVSTHPIEQAARVCDLSGVFCTVYEDAGHKIVWSTFPDGKTWGYDVSSGEWFRRQSFGRQNWRMSTLVKWLGVWLAGDSEAGKLYQVDWALRDEDGAALIGRRTTGALHNNEQRITVNGVRVLLDTGRGPMQPQGPGAIIDPLVIFNPLPQTYTGEAVSHNYRSAGGVRPHVFSIVAGTLPAGLSMDSAGLVTGTPTTLANYAWRVQVQDAQGFQATLDQGENVALGIDGGTGVYTVMLPPPTFVTNLYHYTGPEDALVIAPAVIPWAGGVVIDVVALSPNGQYLAGADASSLNANRFQLLKYDQALNTWTVLAAPATLPTSGPTSLAWSPDGRFLAVGSGTAADKVWIYELSGDVLTKLAQPSPVQSAQSVNIVWSDDGRHIACSNGASSDNLYVYEFDPGTGVIDNMRGSLPSTADQTGAIAFVPETGGRYLIRGNSETAQLVDAIAAPLVALDTVSLPSAFSNMVDSAHFINATDFVSLGDPYLTNGPVGLWRVDVNAGTLDFVSYPADKATVSGSPGTRGASLSVSKQFFAIARGLTNEPKPYVYKITSGALSQFTGFPATPGADTATSCSWRGSR